MFCGVTGEANVRYLVFQQQVNIWGVHQARNDSLTQRQIASLRLLFRAAS
jgi:hypothetical protein